MNDLEGKRIFFYGRLAGMSNRQTVAVVKKFGADVSRKLDESVDMVVIGEAELLGRDWLEFMEKGNEITRNAFESGRLEIVAESDFWRRLPRNGSDERPLETETDASSDVSPAVSPDTCSARPLYTPSMLAELLCVPIATVRLWFQKGLLVAAERIGKLPYFESQEVLVARKLADFTRAGMPLDEIARFVGLWTSARPNLRRVVLDLAISPDALELLLYGDGCLLDLAGQKRIDFDNLDMPRGAGNVETPQEDIGQENIAQENIAQDDVGQDGIEPDDIGQDGAETSPKQREAARPSLLSDRLDEMFAPRTDMLDLTDEQRREYERQVSRHVVALCEAAWRCEEAENRDDAIQLYRAALLAGGSDPDICFQLAELLERQGELGAARERYYAVLEMDEDRIEARANLGRVLARLGDDTNAMAALEGALAIHPDYFEARYELGMLCHKLHRKEEAAEHLRYCLRVMPDGTKTDEIQRVLRDLG